MVSSRVNTASPSATLCLIVRITPTLLEIPGTLSKILQICDVFLKQTRLTWWKLAEVTPDFQTGRLDFSNPLTLDGMKGTQSSP